MSTWFMDVPYSAHYMESRHAVFLCTMMGSVASNESAYLILGMDFLMNIYNACKIISKFKKSKDEKSGRYVVLF